jgi:ssDNA-binding Zn-finger/Zn-ribbon topoisomerase 1
MPSTFKAKASVTVVLNGFLKHIKAALPEYASSLPPKWSWYPPIPGGKHIFRIALDPPVGTVTQIRLSFGKGKDENNCEVSDRDNLLTIYVEGDSYFERMLPLHWETLSDREHHEKNATRLRQILDDLDLIPNDAIMGRDEWVAKYGNKPQCPLCQHPMEIRTSKTDSRFYGCTKWKTTGCNGSVDIILHVERSTDELALAPRCPSCSLPMRRREGRNGFFWGCTGYKSDGSGCDKTIDGPRGMSVLTTYLDWLPSKKAAAAKRKATEVTERMRAEEAHRAIEDARKLAEDPEAEELVNPEAGDGVTWKELFARKTDAETAPEPQLFPPRDAVFGVKPKKSKNPRQRLEDDATLVEKLRKAVVKPEEQQTLSVDDLRARFRDS